MREGEQIAAVEVVTARAPVDARLHRRLQRFLYAEARLLDRRDYTGWLGLLTADVSYRVLAPMMRDTGAEVVEYALIDEGATDLAARVEQIRNPRLSRAENPPSLTRRFISNVEAYTLDAVGDFEVESYLLAYRSRSGFPEGAFYVAERRDVVREVAGEFRIACRTVRLDQSILFNGSLSSIL